MGEQNFERFQGAEPAEQVSSQEVPRLTPQGHGQPAERPAAAPRQQAGVQVSYAPQVVDNLYRMLTESPVRSMQAIDSIASLTCGSEIARRFAVEVRFTAR